MSYTPPYKLTPRIIDLVSRISEAVGSFYGREDLRLHRINRIKTIQGSLAIEGNTLSTDQITAILDGKPVIAPINEVQEVRNAIKYCEKTTVPFYVDCSSKYARCHPCESRDPLVCRTVPSLRSG